MKCSQCNTTDTRVIDSRLTNDGYTIRRRRCCDCCGYRFTTYEQLEVTYPRVIKADGKLEHFRLEKIRAGIERSCEKRFIRKEPIDACVAQITKKITDQHTKEIQSKEIGQIVMEALLDFDQVAYVRFCSVYQKFDNIDEFGQVIKNIGK